MTQLILLDFFSFGPQAGKGGGPSSDPDIRRASLENKALRVTMSASHAGKLSKNWTLYPPATMKNSAQTFISPYKKPVQIHHDDHADPIGRVVDARYVPYSEAGTSSLERDFYQKFQDANTKEAIFESLSLLEESGVLFDSNWRGLGELELTVDITDKDAIEKILDGRYNTVSVGLEPRSAFCSICKKDWAKDRCEHDRGEKDEESGKRMYLVTGEDVDYREVSYINHPADSFAQNKETTFISVTDSASMENTSESLDNVDYRRVVYELIDSVNEDMIEMATTENETTVETPEVEPKIKDEVNPPSPELTLEEALRRCVEDKESFTQDCVDLINLAIEDAALTTKRRKALPGASFCGPNKSYPADTRARGANALSRVSQFGSSSLKAKVRACVCRKYPSLPSCKKGRDENTEWTQDLLDELDETITHPETGQELTLGDYIFGREDALTTDQISNLPDSVFCGPNRSFQIISCDHLSAAVELLDKYQGDGNKEELLSRMKDKEKVYDCQQDSTEEINQTDSAESGCLLKGLTDSDLITLSLDMEQELLSRKLKAPRECSDCVEKDEKLVNLEEKVIDLESTTNVLRKEHRAISADCFAADNALIDCTSKLTNSYRNTLINYKLLVDKEVSKEDIQKAVSEMTLEDLEKTVNVFDLNPVVEFVRSGLSKEMDDEAQVTIEDAESDDSVQDDKEYTEQVISHMKKLASMKEKAGILVAEKHLQRLKDFGEINSDFTLDGISEIVQELG